jgi:predicted nuclease of predicted toxin-antitoxin system
VKFLVDMPLSPALARWLGEQRHDAVHASELGLSTAPDLEILERARAENRVVITADLDFPQLLALLELSAPGLILIRGGDFTEDWARGRLVAVLSALSERDIAESIVVIERHRVRRRRLPLGGG